ncbi:MAG: TatD family hydrolase [Patescibacteria group bacterium]
MFDYIDIHSHLYFPDYDGDRDEEIQKMKDAKIVTINVGVDFETSEKCTLLAEKHDNLFACIGQHPSDLTVHSVFDERFVILAENPRVVALGECGLDYFRITESEKEIKEMQKRVFESHIDLSLKTGKPLMLHVRPKDKVGFDAYKDTLDILESYAQTHGDKLRGNAHFFIGDMDVLKRFLAIGFSVSFGGVLTFTHEYDEYVRYTPLTHIMSESDAPFVAPVPYRGKRNSPLYIPHIVQKIAEIRGEPLETIKTILRDNAINFFKI